jgi:lysophospholipase L1-like esterase
MAHIVLLGDSIFDNKAYVGGAPDVTAHLRQMIPQGWKATLKAVDGSVVENVKRQIQDAPADSTHFFVSVGGNDAIMNADILTMKASSAAEVFDALSNRTTDFEFQYREMLKTTLSGNLPTAVCTIYYPRFQEPIFQKLAVAALSAFNDVIIRQAVLNKLPVLDLRLICSEYDDYANEIEPSSKGGRKIAAKILEVAANHDFSDGKSVIYF